MGKAYAIKWIEDGETFYIIALTVEVAHEAYRDSNKFTKGITGREEFGGTLDEVCAKAGVSPAVAKKRFSGRGSKDEFLLVSPRGVL